MERNRETVISQEIMKTFDFYKGKMNLENTNKLYSKILPLLMFQVSKIVYRFGDNYMGDLP